MSLAPRIILALSLFAGALVLAQNYPATTGGETGSSNDNIGASPSTKTNPRMTPGTSPTPGGTPGATVSPSPARPPSM